MNQLRLPLEIVGLGLYLAAHPFIIFIYIVGSSLREVDAIPYWTAIGLGYLVMLGLALARPGLMKTVPRRRAFDAWLLAAIPAFVLCFLLVMAKWPLTFASWDGHGMGAGGGEANAAFFPWVQAIVWVVVATPTRREPS